MLEDQGFFVPQGRLLLSSVFPDGDMAEVGVVAPGLVFLGLVLQPQVTTAGFLAGQGVTGDQLGEFEVVGDATGVFQTLVELVQISGKP